MSFQSTCSHLLRESTNGGLAQFCLCFPAYRVAFLGPSGSEVNKRVLQLSSLYAVPFVDLPSAFSEALSKQLLLHLRHKKLKELEDLTLEPVDGEAIPSPSETDDSLRQLVALNSSLFLNGRCGEKQDEWRSLEQETQRALCEGALKSILHPSMGPAFIQGQDLQLWGYPSYSSHSVFLHTKNVDYEDDSACLNQIRLIKDASLSKRTNSQQCPLPYLS